MRSFLYTIHTYSGKWIICASFAKIVVVPNLPEVLKLPKLTLHNSS